MSMMPFPPDEKKLKQAKALLDAKRYDEARDILEMIDHHPKARLWLAKLAEMEFTGARKIKPHNRSIHHIFRLLWGILMLLSCGWMSYGFIAAGDLINRIDAIPPVPTLRPLPTINTINMPELSRSTRELSDNLQALSASTDQLVRAGGKLVGTNLSIYYTMCTGLPFFLFFLLLYWRNGIALRQERHHAEMVNVTRRL